MVDGEKRLSWINFIQNTVIQNPQSANIHNSKVPSKSQRIKVEKSNMVISWRHPDLDWIISCDSIFNSSHENNVLHSALMSKDDSNSVLAAEEEFFSSLSLQDSELNVRLVALRSYFSLFIMLYQEISSKSLARSEISKQCIKSMSNWYSIIESGTVLFEFSKLEPYSSDKSLANFISFGDWEQKFNDSIVDPVSMFLSLHDDLLNFLSDDNLPTGLSASVREIVSKVQKDVIISNSRSPATSQNMSKGIIFGSRREMGLNRKGIILSGICKMYFIKCLVDINLGGAK